MKKADAKVLSELTSKVGNLVVENGLSYNQAEQVFEKVLECLKDVPYQSLEPKSE